MRHAYLPRALLPFLGTITLLLLLPPQSIEAVKEAKHCKAHKCEVWSKHAHACVSSCESACDVCQHGKCVSACQSSRCEQCEEETGQCISTCASCEKCDHEGTCVAKCNADHCLRCESSGNEEEEDRCESICEDPCTVCDGYGQCVARCPEEQCKVCDKHGECVDACPPCTRCDGQGNCEDQCGSEEYCDAAKDKCVPIKEGDCSGPCEVHSEYGCTYDESLEDKCGQCPGEPEYGECHCIEKPVVFSKGLSVGPYKNVYRTFTELECNLTSALQHIKGCTEDTDCADCDPCTVDTCAYGSCVHTHIHYDEARRCGACQDFEPDRYGNRCNDHNPCTFDRCVYGQCVHLQNKRCLEQPHVADWSWSLVRDVMDP